MRFALAYPSHRALCSAAWVFSWLFSLVFSSFTVLCSFIGVVVGFRGTRELLSLTFSLPWWILIHFFFLWTITAVGIVYNQTASLLLSACQTRHVEIASARTMTFAAYKLDFHSWIHIQLQVADPYTLPSPGLRWEKHSEHLAALEASFNSQLGGAVFERY